MGRSRVLSFISAFGGPGRSNTADPTPAASITQSATFPQMHDLHTSPPHHHASAARDSPTPIKTRPERSASRPMSMVLAYQPTTMDYAYDTLPELQPIFTFLNGHSNKLYQEGYFLKLNDLDSQGRPFAERQWVEYFAQLVGTVLSLWDAAALDAAGPDGEVAPTFINLADASIKMIETLPTRNEGMQPLQNVLSVSTAGKNRYLLHFSSLHSLTQWTAGIRLSMFEHASLHETYTGSLIAGKGKDLNNIRTIMERNRFVHEDWARVRFGAGTPWRRCWCVITPPDEKEYQKLQKQMKKKSAYDRQTPVLKGSVKFYETRKTKKTQPIATITDAYSAYAIYPQSKALIDQSTLIKVEGQVTLHTQPQSTTEGFVFVLPEVHPAVSGFEMMLRWLFPVYDTFGLYGRPTRLIAEINSTKSLMFALPKKKRYGYLETLDVAALIHAKGSQNWSEREWRRQLKEATAQRMVQNRSNPNSVSGTRKSKRASLGQMRSGQIRYEDSSGSSSPSGPPDYNRSSDAILTLQKRTASAPAGPSNQGHVRSASESTALMYAGNRTRDSDSPTNSFVREGIPSTVVEGTGEHDEAQNDSDTSNGRSSPEDNAQPSRATEMVQIEQGLPPRQPPAPVSAPPAFAHSPTDVPPNQPYNPPELRRAKSRMSSTTLSQLVDAGKMSGLSVAAAGASAAWKSHDGERGVIDENTSRTRGAPTDREDFSKRLLADDTTPRSQDQPPPVPPHGSQASRWQADTPPPPPKHNPDSLLLNSRKSILRKPVPQNTQVQTQNLPQASQGPPDSATMTSTTASSFDDFRHTFDEDALDKVLPRGPSFSTERDVRPDDESIYDNASTVSPDYASSHKSDSTKYSGRSDPRPRMGVMKTVGAADPKQEVTIGDARYFANDKAPELDPNIPLVDFGPTHVYVPTTRRPSTSDTLTKFNQDSSRERRLSAGGKNSPIITADNRRHSRSPSTDDRRRSVLWQPGIAVNGRSSPGPRITPEQFVHQRAASNPRVNTPPFTHHRGLSNSTPPPRPASGDWTSHVRVNSGLENLPSRPHSRGASTMLSNSKDLSAQLSAREQEHVARVTGSPFFNMSADTKKPSPNLGGGLVGTIDAREREKKSVKEGLSGQMVHHAIQQRHQQVQQDYLQQQYQQQQHQQQLAMQQQQQQQMYGAQPYHSKRQSMYSIGSASWNNFDQQQPQQWASNQSHAGWTASPQVPVQGTPSVMHNQSQYFQQQPQHYGGGSPNFQHY